MKKEPTPELEAELDEDIVVGEDLDVVAADDPELLEERKVRDPLAAPYSRFRDNGKLYPDSEPPGCYGAELVGCGFACRQCWSTYGLRGKDKMKWMSPDQVATKLIEGAYKNNRRLVRITAGEPFLYPDHVIEVVRLVLAHEMDPPLRVQIETNGLYATPQVVQRLNEIAADHVMPFNPAFPLENEQDRSRLGIWWSYKAPTENHWVWHTGRTPDEFDQMTDNLVWALENANSIDIWVGLMAQLCETEDLQEDFAMAMEDLRKGMSNKVAYEYFTTDHPSLRAIDERMGQRRLSTATKLGWVGIGEGWSEEEILANGLAPPYPKKKVEMQDPV